MSVVAELVNKLAGRKAEHAAAVKRGWREIVTELADGKKVKPDDAEQMLAEAGKTPADLAAAVQIELDRRRWRAQIEPEPALREQLAKLDQLQIANRNRLDEANAAFQLEGGRLNEAREGVERQLAAIERAKIQLRESATDEAKSACAAEFKGLVGANLRRQFLVEQLSQTSGVVQVLNCNGDTVFAANINRRRLELKGNIRRLEMPNVGSLEKAQLPELRRVLAGLDVEEKSCRKELAELEKRIDKLNRDNPADAVLLS